METYSSLRNIAIIAHVDHGKTTLVDHLLRQGGLFRENEATEDRMMDSMSQERERGITIAAKNGSFSYKGIKINIVDTPGHSDFGGEVERTLNMVDGCILLVDAAEGPLPQTRFVLKKALEQNKKILVLINKIDRGDARAEEVLNEVFDLFIDLDAEEAQAEFIPMYAVAREGICVKELTDYPPQEKNLNVLMDAIVEQVPAPEQNVDAPLQLLISNIDYSDYVGRLGIGRIKQGKMKVGDFVHLHTVEGPKKFKLTALFAFRGNKQVSAEELGAGDVAVFAGYEDLSIGDTVSALDYEPLPRIKIDEPTVGIEVSVNDSPFNGREGKQVTARKILERLEREMLYNVALRLEKTERTETWKLIGRGELQLGVVIEQMRREGYEVLISKPRVEMKVENGQTLEPIEHVVIDVEDLYAGVVTEKLGKRKGILVSMDSKGSGRTRIEFKIPSRGLIGYRSEFMTDTRGTGLLNARFEGWEPYKGDLRTRINGAIVADRQGKVTAYALDGVEQRGRLFIEPGIEVYGGMVVGEHAKDTELLVNVAKEKKLTNMRASGNDDAVKLAPIVKMTLERAMEWINEDELIEVTPLSLRIRCRQLDANKRKK